MYITKLAHVIYRENISTEKIENFRSKNFDIFTQNRDCGYTLEPP